METNIFDNVYNVINSYISYGQQIILSFLFILSIFLIVISVILYWECFWKDKLLKIINKINKSWFIK